MNELALLLCTLPCEFVDEEGKIQPNQMLVSKFTLFSKVRVCALTKVLMIPLMQIIGHLPRWQCRCPLKLVCPSCSSSLPSIGNPNLCLSCRGFNVLRPPPGYVNDRSLLLWSYFMTHMEYESNLESVTAIEFSEKVVGWKKQLESSWENLESTRRSKYAKKYAKKQRERRGQMFLYDTETRPSVRHLLSFLFWLCDDVHGLEKESDLLRFEKMLKLPNRKLSFPLRQQRCIVALQNTKMKRFWNLIQSDLWNAYHSFNLFYIQINN